VRSQPLPSTGTQFPDCVKFGFEGNAYPVRSFSTRSLARGPPSNPKNSKQL
jgi:hypothetical protein